VPIAETRQIADAGEPALVGQLAAVPETLGQGAGLGRRAARREKAGDVERSLTDASAGVIAGERVVRDELLAHVEQDVVELGGVVGDHHRRVVHALPRVGVEHRHRSGHGVDDTVHDADLEVGVVVERGGQRVARLVAEGGDEEPAVEFLELG
jgi:hypothetical protein